MNITPHEEVGREAGEIDMLPTERRDVYEKFVGNMPTLLAQMGRRPAEIDGIPMHDGAHYQVEAGGTE